MLEEIKKLIYNTYKPDDKIGIFFSLFDDKGNLIISNGVLTSDKSLEDMINLLYNGILKKEESKTKHIIIDIVDKITEQKDINSFLQMDTKTNGVLLVATKGDKTGVILPNTKGITSMKQAVAGIKSKYQMEGDVIISTFTVNELILNR